MKRSSLKDSIPAWILLFCISLAWGCTQAEKTGDSDQVQKPLVVFLARHGEKVDQSRDPELSPAGYVRSATLAQTLKDAGIEQVHSTDYIRTRKTAEPTAAIYGVEVNLYDPSDLGAFAEKLRRQGGCHLVVGHSSTTPRLVELLGGESGSEIYEPTEYDRLYLLRIDERGKVSTLLLRYGVPFVPDYA